MGEWLAEALLKLLVSTGMRWIARWLYAQRLHEKLLGWLRQRAGHSSNFVTEREIRNWGIVGAVDSQLITEQCREAIVKTLGRYRLITKQWDPVLSKSLTFDWKGFFVYASPVLEAQVAPLLSAIFKGANIVSFVVLPFPRTRKVALPHRFVRALEDGLGGSRGVYEVFFSSAMLEGKIGPGPLGRIQEGEKILILQPMAMDDDYLDRVLQSIRGRSMGEVAGIVTLVDASGRGRARWSGTPPERVLLELALSRQRAQEVHE